MMSKEKRRVPKLRFPGFTEDWEQRKFVDLLDLQNGIRRGPFGSSLKKDSFVKKSDYVVYEQQNAIYDNYETRYFISREKYNELIRFNIQPGDFIMSGAGTIGRISMVPDGIKKGVFNQALIRFKVNKDFVDPLYFLKFMQSDMMQKQLTQANPGSAMTNLVPMDELKKWNIVIPSLEEQNRISTFIKQIDDVITLHQRKLDNLKLKKKALLQKLFPKNGERYPELRFPGFTDAWEQRKLSDVLVERNEQQVETSEYPLMSFVQGLGVTPKGERYDRSFLVLDQSKKYKRTELGDFIYSSNNLETGSIGINKTGKAVISPVYSIFQGVSIGDSQFIGIMSLLPRFIAKMIRFRQGVVYGQWRIHETDFLDISVLIPSVDERTKITQLILSIEELITLHQRKLEHLQLQKKALLQQLFI
ncbi:restriction endonuclease subunit S [Veillonella sp. Ser01]